MRPALRFPPPMAGALAGAALLLLMRPYEGLQHDGLLYFGQALRRSQMPGLDADLFFVGGSQDSYSLYSRLVAPLFAALGPAVTNQALLLLGLLGMALGVALLLRRLGLSPAWGVLALAVMSPMYGGLRKFGVTENFLTARSLAEPLLVASLLPLVQGRLALAAAVQLGAAALHPLMALPVLVVTWLVAAQRDRRWLALALLPLAGLVAMALGVPWMARWRTTYDPVWWELVSTSSTQLLLGNWTTADVATVLTDVAMLAVLGLSATLPPRARPVLLALVWATGALLLTHAVGTDLLRSTWITQLQPWRVLWLTHLLATVLAPALIARQWRQGGLWRLGAALLALACMCSHAGYDAGLIVLAAWALTCLAAARGVSASPGIVRLGVGVCGALLAAVCAWRVAFELERLYWRPPTWPALDAACHVLAAPVLAFSLAAGALWLARRAPRCRSALAAGALAMFALSLTLWDRRGDLARFVESPPETSPQARPFAALIPPRSSVYWPEQLGGTWGLLQRTSHYSRQQGSGMAFNRATAELIGPRRDAYAGIRQDLDACEASAALQGTPEMLAGCTLPTPARLHALCSGPVHPEFFVFERPLQTPPRAVWTHGRVTLHLYACTQFDAAPARR